MRDVLGGCDDLQGLRQGARIGQFIAHIGSVRRNREATSHDQLGRGTLEHALSAPVAGLVEAFEEGPQVAMVMLSTLRGQRPSKRSTGLLVWGVWVLPSGAAPSACDKCVQSHQP